MNIENKFPVMVFKREYEGKTFYSLGLSRKDRDGNYINGYMTCRFKNGVEVPDKAKIYLKNAWLDFYLKEKETKPYIFISEFETVEEVIDSTKAEAEEQIDPFKEFGQEITLTDEDLPF